MTAAGLAAVTLPQADGTARAPAWMPVAGTAGAG